MALHQPDQVGPYPIEVLHRIRRDELSDYPRTARSLRGVDVVSIQHAFGIWGGPDGESVLDFLGALSLPAVATLHTIPRDPTTRQQSILRELARGVRTTVVMSRSAATLLASAYGVDPARIEVIPYGAPNLPLVPPDGLKPGLGLAGRRLILSFGLLGPKKGCELALEAMPAIVARHPTVCYAILGATHPDELARNGEAYRASLLERVEALGLIRNVQFVDRFVGRVELIRWLEAADVFLVSGVDPDLSASGPIVHAMAAGRPVVSTPGAYASEILSDGRGVVVGSASPDAIAGAVDLLLSDEDLRSSIGRRAHEHSRRTMWSEVGTDYRRLFTRLTSRPLAPLGLRLDAAPA